MSASIASGFKRGDRSIFKAGQEGAGVVDPHGFDFTGKVVFPFFDKGFSHGGHAGNAAADPDSCVDAVGQKVTGHSAASRSPVQPPQSCATLRQVRGKGPILKEDGPVVEDAAQPPLLPKPLGKGQSRYTTI